MLFRRNQSKPQNRIVSLIGAGTRIDGNILFSGGLRVDGEVIGCVIASGDGPSTLIVSENAKIEGEIRVSHVVINGIVSGPVFASEYLELHAKSRVTGDVHYKTLEMQQGAIIEGVLIHDNGNMNDKVVAFRPLSAD